jgi:alanine dehydrogenase
LHLLGTLLLTRSDISGLLPFDQYIAAVERAFFLYAQKDAIKPGMMHIESVDGAFHIKAGVVDQGKRLFGLKANGNFPNNLSRFRIPNVHGTLLLSDGHTGYPLAVMDSREITVKRTGAATAIAAKYLARPESSTATLCGCGTQGRIQLEALAHVLPLKKVYAMSRDVANARKFAAEMGEKLSIPVTAIEDLPRALQESDVCVTCTRSEHYFVHKKDVPPGLFIAAVGSDTAEKQELEPAILKSSKVVADILGQCAKIGELHHAIEEGMSTNQVHGELGQIVAGMKPGRTAPDEIVVFDSTGAAFQDVAAAAAVYEMALRDGRGQRVNFFQ